MMILAQVVAGAAAAALVPTLVMLIAATYNGKQKERALGLLGGAFSLGIVLAFLIAGYLATLVSWRVTFGLVALMAALIYRLSANLQPVESHAVSIDEVGVVLIATAILLISVGSDNLSHWGALLAGPAAPFAVAGMSPAPIMILCGIFLVQGFLTWSRRRVRAGGTPLLSLEVIDTRPERAALFSLFAISVLQSAVIFLIPLYMQIVQGRSSLETAIAVIPFSLASVTAAVLVVRLYDRMSPARIGRWGFLIVAIGVALLGAVIRNDWGDTMVVLGMAVTGLGEGALMTLMFNVLVSASPKTLAGDVGSLRGAANNLAGAVGTAMAGALVVGLLGTTLHRDLAHNPHLPDELKAQVNLDDISFISNDRLREVLAATKATPEQVTEAVRLNTDARLLSLKVTFFTLAGIALLGFFPAGALPGYARDDTPRGAPGSVASEGHARSTTAPVA
jgi:MFS family permease